MQSVRIFPRSASHCVSLLAARLFLCDDVRAPYFSRSFTDAAAASRRWKMEEGDKIYSVDAGKESELCRLTMGHEEGAENSL